MATMDYQRDAMKRRIVLMSGIAVLVGSVMMFGGAFSGSNEAGDNRSIRQLQAAAPAEGSSDYDQSESVSLPDWTDIMTNVWDKVTPADVPFFWYIPKAGGLTFHKICSECLKLNIASARGKDNGGSVSRRIRKENIDIR